MRIYHTASDAYDFIDQLVIPDFALFKRGLADEETAIEWARLHWSEADYVDYTRSDYWWQTWHCPAKVRQPT